MKLVWLVILLILIGVVASLGAFFGISMDDAENDVQNISEPAKNPIYIPSNITKANPNILVGGGGSSFDTTNIVDVKDSVLYTIQGTVLSIGTPIDYTMPLPTAIFEDGEEYYEPHGAVPVTISVDKVHKGELNVGEFTFYLRSIKNPDGKYYLTPSQPQFELNEKVIVHISRNDDFAEFVGVDDYYYVVLLQYGKYKIQDNMAFSQSHSSGKPLLQVQQEALEWGRIFLFTLQTLMD